MMLEYSSVPIFGFFFILRMDKRKLLKGGAQKIREKKQKLMQESAKHCSKITDIYNNISKPNAVKPVHDISLTPDEATTIANCTSEASTSTPSEITNICTSDESKNSTKSESSENILQSSDFTYLPDSYFLRPSLNDQQDFISKHPCQPPVSKNLPFLPHQVFTRPNGSSRKWLSFCKEKNGLFCFICLLYSDSTNQSPFVTGGMSDWRHTIQRINEHENSRIHNKCTEAHIINVKRKDIYSTLWAENSTLRQKNANDRRRILEIVIDVVKFIGKRGIAFRSHRNENANSLKDVTLDHGNFLETILLLSKYEPVLQRHLSVITKYADCQRKGSTVTLLSKTTIDYVIRSIKTVMRRMILAEICETNFFSLQIDTTTDINQMDQCSVIIRYIYRDNIYERVLGLLSCTDSTGLGMCNLITNFLEGIHVDIKKCIGNSTDGAANMRGIYNGFTKWLSEKSPKQIHVWCYAHALNLVLVDSTTTVLEGFSMFSLIHECGKFFKESYQRMDVWRLINEKTKFRKLHLIGDTRWSSKYAALKQIFGTFDDRSNCLYVEVILALNTIVSSDKFNASVRQKAKSILDKMLSFKIILTAHIYLKIFRYTEPVTKYLQSSGLDYLLAFNMILQATSSLKSISRQFNSILDSSKAFVLECNNSLENANCDLIIEDELPAARIRKIRKMNDENCSDYSFSCPTKQFEVSVYNAIMDTTISSLESRFKEHMKLYEEISILDPKNFSKPLSPNSFDYLGELLSHYAQIDIQDLREEFKDLVSKWETLKNSVDDQKHVEEDSDSEPEASSETLFRHSKSAKPNCDFCRNCVRCVYKLLTKFNLYSSAYSNVFMAYAFVLTLSTTQVQCERTFSKLKILKTRLRSTMKQDNLESLILLNMEKETLAKTTVQDIIAEICNIAPGIKNYLNG